MACRRSIIARAKLLYLPQHRVAPSFSHIHRDENDRESTDPLLRNLEFQSYFRSRFCGARSNFHGYNSFFQERRSAIPTSCGSFFVRSMSSANVGGGAANEVEIMADVLGNKTLEVASQAAPVINEVAAAAADSFFPVAALQYLVDYVHTMTGFDWWASIAITTLLIRWIQVPIMINQIKATSKFTLLRPKLEEINREMQSGDMSPAAIADGRARTKQLFKEYGVTPFTPMKGLLITGPIFCCFFFALRNMVEKVPSFKEGGAFWFTDLTAVDSMHIFPVLTALTFWITVECNAQDGLEGNPSAKLIKNISRGFAVLTVPLTAGFPQAIFCYWITSNFFSLAYGLVIRKPGVKKFLGIPIIPVAPPSTDQKPAFSFFEAMKKYSEAQRKQFSAELSSPSVSPVVEVSSKPTNQRIQSTSVLNQRISSLEKEVKGRKKGKKRR